MPTRGKQWFSHRGIGPFRSASASDYFRTNPRVARLGGFCLASLFGAYVVFGPPGSMDAELVAYQMTASVTACTKLMPRLLKTTGFRKVPTSTRVASL